MNISKVINKVVNIIVDCVKDSEFADLTITVQNTNDHSYSVYLGLPLVERLYGFNVDYYNFAVDDPLTIKFYNFYQYDIIEKHRPGYEYDWLVSESFNPDDQDLEDEVRECVYDRMLTYIPMDKNGVDRVAEYLIDIPSLTNKAEKYEELEYLVAEFASKLPASLQRDNPIDQLKVLFNQLTFN